MTATLDKYGRIVIPKVVREAIGLKENMALQLSQEGNKIIIEPILNYVEEGAFLFFTGRIDGHSTDWVNEDRTLRDEELLGL